MRSRSEIKLEAQSKLKGNVFKIIVAVIIVSIIFTIFSNLTDLLNIKTEVVTIKNYGELTETTTTPTPFGVIWSIISTAFGLFLNFGTVTFSLKLIRGENPKYSDLFAPFKSNFFKIVIVSLLTAIFITLGFACLCIPGIIISIGLSLCNYIMVDNTKLKTMDVIKKSWNMMNGHKADFFELILSFIGWFLLCLFIIPMIYVIPYFILTVAIFYEELKKLN